MFKAVAVVALLCACGAVVYYFLIALPAHNRAVLDFEKQKYQDQKAKQEEAEQKSEASKVERKVDLDLCLSSAEAAYLDAVKRNGTPDRQGGYSVPTSALNIIQRQKDASISACFKK